MAKETTTIYIDDSAIWVLISEGREIHNWGNIPLEPGLVKEGVILDKDAVADKIAQLWQTVATRTREVAIGIGETIQTTEVISPGKVIAGISGINCLHRLLTLPELPKDLLPEAVRREADRVLGVPLEEHYLTWQVLPSAKGEMLVYLIASPRNAVDSLLSTLRQAGFDPYLMDLKPLAIARTITELKAIIVDVQPCSLDIIIMVDRIPQVVRSVSLPEEASLEERMPLIREELDRAITFYNSSHMDKPIEADVPLLVSGELAEREDMWSLLLGRRQYPVQVLPSPMEAREGFPHSQYVTNIGLALKEVLATEKGAIVYSLVDLNVLPPAYLPRRRPLSEILYIPVIIIGIALIAWLAVSFVQTSGRVDDLHEELTTINLNIASINQQITTVNAEINELQSWISLIQTHSDSLNAQVEQLNDDVAELGDELATIEGGGSAIEEEMASLNQNMDKLNEDMEELLAQLSTVRDDVLTIDNGISNLGQDLDQLSGDIESLAARVSIIEDDISDVNSVVNNLNQVIAEVKQKIPDVDLLSPLECDLTSLWQQLNSLNEDIAGIKGTIPQIQEQISSLNTALNAINTALGFADIRDEVNADLDVVINHEMSVVLANVSHSIGSVTVTGSAEHEDYIFEYADYLRASEREDGSKRFELVVLTSIAGEEPELSFSIILIK